MWAMKSMCGATHAQAKKCWYHDGDKPDLDKCAANSCECAAGYLPFRGLCTKAAGPRVQQIHEYCAGKWCNGNAPENAEFECCLSLGTWEKQRFGYNFRPDNLKVTVATSGGLAYQAGLGNYIDYNIVQMN